MVLGFGDRLTNFTDVMSAQLRRIATLSGHLQLRSSQSAHVRLVSTSAAPKRGVALVVGAGDATGGAICKQFASEGFTGVHPNLSVEVPSSQFSRVQHTSPV